MTAVMTGRTRANRVEKILADHVARERRTLADLRTLGFDFNSVGQAQKYLKAQKTLAAMNHEQVIRMVAGISETSNQGVK